MISVSTQISCLSWHAVAARKLVGCIKWCIVIKILNRICELRDIHRVNFWLNDAITEDSELLRLKVREISGCSDLTIDVS